MKRRGSDQPGPSKERRGSTRDSTHSYPAAETTANERNGETTGEIVRKSLLASALPDKVRFAKTLSHDVKSYDIITLSSAEAESSAQAEAKQEVGEDLKKERRSHRKKDHAANDAYNLIRRGSVMPDPLVEPSRRDSIQAQLLETFRRGNLKRGLDSDTSSRRRESIDGGALKQLVEYLKTKNVERIDDAGEILNTISLAPSSVSTMVSFTDILETSPNDPHSFSRCDLLYVDNLEIHWNVRFDKEIIEGDITMEVRRRKAGITTLSLDTNSLDIKMVKVNGRTSSYALFQHRAELGSRMDIEMPDTKADSYNIYIKYETDPKASGLQWLKSNFEGKRPFVFSQCQSIQCRSILPIQDTPSNKVKYAARITTPTGMRVLMSAPREKQFVMHPDGRSTHYFRQDVPVSPYLIAFAIGHLAWARVCDRTTVWALPEYIDRVKRELTCTEDLLCIAETICGDYMWGRYDVLVLPQSEFNLSALENPSLTFINPSLVSGDGSMANYVAHEIAHSWVGNVVTHANYEHLWISEGFANFIGRKILGKRYGHETRLFAASRGFKDLQMVIDIYGGDHPLTSLVADLSQRRPREAVLIVPYEKGHTLLYYLELITGDTYEMDQYIKEYIATFKYQSINSSMFRTHFIEFFSKSRALKDIDWNAWFNAPGMPPFHPDYHTSLEETCSALREMWLRWARAEPCPFSELDMRVLSTMQILEFLSQMLESPPLQLFKLEAMERLYCLEESENPDARLKWFLLCLRGHWRGKVEPALAFAREDGRQFCVLAVFHELTQWEEMREEATVAFYRMRNAISVGTMRVLAALLRVDPSAEPPSGLLAEPAPPEPPPPPAPPLAAAATASRRRTVAGLEKLDKLDKLGERRAAEEALGAGARRRSSVAHDDAALLSVRRKSVLTPLAPHAPATASTTTTATATTDAGKRPP